MEVKIGVFLGLLSLVWASLELTCTKDECHCEWINPDKPSIFVSVNEGQLGNVFYNYVALLALKMRFNARVYFPQARMELLKGLFDNLEIESAEDHVCNFSRDYNTFLGNRDKVWQKKIMDYFKAKIGIEELPLAENGYTLIIPPEYEHLMPEILHSKDFRVLDQDSMPDSWTLFKDSHFEKVEENQLQIGKAVLLYQQNYDSKFPLETKGMEQRFDDNFKFKKKFIKSAEKTMKKLKKKFQMFVGVHVRRTDYQDFELAHGLKPVKASYYLEAMDLYRRFYQGQKMAFLVISDDIQWCQKHLTNKSKDVFFTSDPNAGHVQGIGQDLALMSLCNHTIISRGSFSFWVSVFAGGSTVLPCHFPTYQEDRSRIHHFVCFRHPLEMPLNRFYPISN